MFQLARGKGYPALFHTMDVGENGEAICNESHQASRSVSFPVCSAMVPNVDNCPKYLGETTDRWLRWAERGQVGRWPPDTQCT